MLWEAKNNASGSYTTMKTPSSYKISWEDLDNKSYRSITNGNLIRSRLTSKWFSGSFTFNYLTESEAENILSMVNSDPLYVRIKSPLFGTSGVIEIQCYVSKASIEMLKNDTTNNNNQEWTSLSFNIIQSKVIGGQ